MPIPRSRNGSDGWNIANNGFDVKLRGQWCDRLIQDGADAFTVFPGLRAPGTDARPTQGGSHVPVIFLSHRVGFGL